MNKRWIQALRSSAQQAESAKERILSEPSGTLKITRSTCSLQPPFGPVSYGALAKAISKRLYARALPRVLPLTYLLVICHVQL